ncbi:MAG: UDP-forming cellulose synthase catalytic subunit, partial [Gammaproteobacteria bacterium]|nr:UDP-forming cellulose synthase catalytic subunit [Gammaproteobacteria bacterium]
NLNPRHRTPLPLPANRDEWPTVDVLIPSYNESAELLETTLLGALNLRYPADKLRIHLLDDGGTDARCRNPKMARTAMARRRELKQLCARLGVHYRTRKENNHAKAGNLNATLPHLGGDLILILDADHVPTVDFLEKTVGFFIADPKMFLVQTPHNFLNADPIEKNLDTLSVMPSETELFHGVIQTGLDGWEASFFCGSAALMRRSLLLQVNGIQGDTITEDAETALILHARGYRSAFLNEPLSSGLQPETVTALVAQRIRWAQGALQILLLKNPLRIPGLKLTQRLSYLTSFSYWFFPFARAIFLLAPAAYLLFDLKVYNATLSQYALYGLPYILSTLFFTEFVYGRVRWPVISDLYETVQAFMAVPALSQVFIRPRRPTFKVTPKGELLERDFISQLAWPYYLLLGIIVASLAAGAWRYEIDPAAHGELVFTLFWEFFNFVIVIGAIGVMLERRQRRQTPRITFAPALPALVMGHDDRKYLARVCNASCGGAELILHKRFTPWPGTFLRIYTTVAALGTQRLLHAQVTSVNGRRIGVAFRPRDVAEQRAVVALVYGDSAQLRRRLERRHRRANVLQALIFVFLRGGRGVLGHLSVALQTALGIRRPPRVEPALRRNVTTGTHG